MTISTFGAAVAVYQQHIVTQQTQNDPAQSATVEVPETAMPTNPMMDSLLKHLECSKESETAWNEK